MSISSGFRVDKIGKRRWVVVPISPHAKVIYNQYTHYAFFTREDACASIKKMVLKRDRRLDPETIEDERERLLALDILDRLREERECAENQ